jgi:hypothetical protein
MAKFDFRGQKVNNQVVAETIGTVNFGGVQNKDELIVELRKLISEVAKATQEGIVNKEVSTGITLHIEKAIFEAEKPEPKKKKITENIEGAKSLLDGVTSASNLVSALITAAKIAGSLFL